MKRVIYLIVLLVFIFLTASPADAQNPGKKWLQYLNPEQAGWSSEKLLDARKYADSIGTAAFMLIYDGRVVYSWGEIERRFMCHSVRKSLLSALYGIYVDEGEIDLSKTLAEMGIDDVHSLSEREKQARISDLLKARSGVYHPAAYETESMKKARPERDSHEPGTFWYYNNWDFNTACHILMQHSGQVIFKDFKEKIADPLEMEDFRLEDCYYHLEAEHSMYPAYPFRMSARDLARIGQWFLQEGQWNGRQIVSQSWVEESTTPYSMNTRTEGRGYAYMWWTGIYGDEHPNYSAQGVGNQAVIVFPDENIVMVNRANTFEGERVSTSDLIRLTEMLFDARDTSPRPQVILKDLTDYLDRFVGNFTTADGGSINITREEDGRLLMDTHGRGEFFLIPHGKNEFMIEDVRRIVRFKENDRGNISREIVYE